MHSRRQLKREAVLQPADFDEIRRRRRSRNRFGFAYQLGFVRLLNRFPRQRPFEVLDELVTFTAVQLELAPSLIVSYQQRQQTVSEHQQQIAAYLGLRTLGEAEAAVLEQFLFEQACRLERSAALEHRAQEFLKERRILRPGQSTILRIVGEQRRLAREHIFERIASGLSFDLRRTLNDLLQVRETEKFSELQKIKANPSKPSVDGMLALLRKLAVIEKTGVLGVDLTWLNANYQRAVFHQVRKSSADRLRELSVARRHAVLVCFLWQSYRDAVDQVVDMFDKLLTRTETHAKNELSEQMRRQQKMIRGSLATLKTLGTVILDEEIADEELREALFAQVPREELTECVTGLDEWVSGKKSDLFYGVARRYSMLRRFSPALLEALDLEPDTDGEANPSLRALALLKELNLTGRRKLPDDAPTDFVPKRLQPIVGQGEGADRRAWECALLLQIRDEIKSGNVTVRQSKRFASLDDFFMDSERWREMREEFFSRAGLPMDGQAAVEHLTSRLGNAFERFIASAPANSYAVVDEKGWRLSADTPERRDPETEQRVERLKSWLAANMRRIMLPDLLIEVDNELAFTQHFAAAAQPDDDMIAVIVELERRGLAYAVDGDVFYAVDRFPEYGKLSHRKLEDMAAGARVEVDERKRHPMDFALWKGSKPGEPTWPSPWGPGRPGWHIECSAMSSKFLGQPFDLHGGGSDLIFPHHENEIAQSEGAAETMFARYWMHNEMVTREQEKMSKSLGNFLTIREAVTLAEPEALRCFFLGAHYRSPLDFSRDRLLEEEKRVLRIYEALARADAALAARGTTWQAASAASEVPSDSKLVPAVVAAMDDDLNTARAIGHIFDHVRELNRALDAGTEDTIALMRGDLATVGGFLGIMSAEPAAFVEKTRGRGALGEQIEVAEIENLIAERNAARAQRDFEQADEIRSRLKERGIVLEDCAEGTKWRAERT